MLNTHYYLTAKSLKYIRKITVWYRSQYLFLRMGHFLCWSVAMSLLSWADNHNMWLCCKSKTPKNSAQHYLCLSIYISFRFVWWWSCIGLNKSNVVYNFDYWLGPSFKNLLTQESEYFDLWVKLLRVPSDLRGCLTFIGSTCVYVCVHVCDVWVDVNLQNIEAL